MVADNSFPTGSNSGFFLPAVLYSLSGHVLYIIYLRYFSPLSAIPGPFLASVSSIYSFKQWSSPLIHRENIKLHERYGKIVRVGPNEVSLVDRDALAAIYGSGSKMSKSAAYSMWGGGEFNLFGEMSFDIHQRRRRAVNGPYLMSNVSKLESGCDEILEKFLNHLRGLDAARTVDLGLYYHLFLFDELLQMTFGFDGGFLEGTANRKTLGLIANIGRHMQTAAGIPIISRALGMMAMIWEYVRRDKSVGDEIFFTDKLVDKHASQEKQGDMSPNMLSMFNIKRDEGTVPDVAVRHMAGNNIFAGTDTTNSALRTITHLILKHPEVHRHLLAEIDTATESSNPGRRVISLQEALNMPYLQACIQEGLRLHPLVGVPLPRVVSQEGLVCCGHHLPSGTVVSTNAWSIHRQTDIFGIDAKEFKPDRWLDGRKTSQMDACFFAFGLGSFSCIGRNLAWMTLSKVLATVFAQIDLELVHPEMDLEESCAWFVHFSGLEVKMRERKRAVPSVY